MAADDLFSGAAEERLVSRAPLAARLRPRTLDDIIGQQHLVGPGAPLRALIEADRLTSAILWGPPGTGKTTLASVLATAARWSRGRASCSASRARGRSSSWTRSTGSTAPSRTPSCPRSRRG